MGLLEDAIAAGDTKAMAELSPLFASAQYNMAAPPGSTPDPRSPQGFTIADPAQLDRFMQEYGQRARSVALDSILDRSAREQDANKMKIMETAGKLDPELQELVMQRLGIQRPGGPQQPGTLDRATQRKLEAEKQLATHKNTLGADDREARISQAQARLEQTQMQMVLNQMLKERGMDINQQRADTGQQGEQRRQQTAAMPSLPPKQAQAIMESLALSGASPEQLSAMAERMGFTAGGETYEKGGLFGFGATQVPALGRAPAGQPAANPRAATPQGGALRMKSKSGKPMIYNQSTDKWEYDQ